MNKIFVSTKPNKRETLWASFRIDGEAFAYSEKLSAAHPTWTVRLQYAWFKNAQG